MRTTSPASDRSHLTDLIDFLQASPSPYHAVESARRRLDRQGWKELAMSEPWTAAEVGGRRYCVRGGAIVAWDASGADLAAHGFRIIGAHTDSPNLRVKPNPDVTSVGYRQLGVEIYGGVLANSWLDRDLGLSGRLVLRDGSTALALIERPIARVAQLAIHLDREVNERGLVLDKQLHLLPLTGLDREGGRSAVEIAATSAGVEPEDVVAYDLMLHDLTAPALLGVDEEFLAAARIDNQFSCWAAITALAARSAASGAVPLVALFDHEEIGSSSTTGAAGPLLEQVVRRLGAALAPGVDALERALGASSCVSADMAHAVHPNYAERHEPNHRPIPNGGPVVKVNANQRYATDATTAAAFAASCERAGVPVQTFVSRNSQPCGSTIGPITATRLGIATVDIGCAMLSMHSARELCGADDADLLVRALVEHLAPTLG